MYSEFFYFSCQIQPKVYSKAKCNVTFNAEKSIRRQLKKTKINKKKRKNTFLDWYSSLAVSTRVVGRVTYLPRTRAL